MLFDLRARGRRRTIKVIYLALAILMGLGLVLFGIGGNVSGGLFDAISEDSGTSGNEAIEKRIDSAEKRLQVNPRDAAQWAVLTKAQVQLAGGDFDENTGKYTADGQTKLKVAARSWERYLALEPPNPDDSLATLMVQALGPAGLNQPHKAVRAQEIVVDKREPSTGLYLQLATLAYSAGQTRKGDLAGEKAAELAPKDQRKLIKDQLKKLREDSINAPLGSQPAPSG